MQSMAKASRVGCVNIFSGIERYLAILAAMCRAPPPAAPNGPARHEVSAPPSPPRLRRTSPPSLGYGTTRRTGRRNDAKRTWLSPSSFILLPSNFSPPLSLQNVKEQGARAPDKAHITTV
jgi:hypothetical protein